MAQRTDIAGEGTRRTTTLMLPGWKGSGPRHWQSIWQRQRPEIERVEQASWDQPVLADWAETLEKAVRAARSPVLLVAHSLACALVAHWARAGSAGRVSGALLVAPADVDDPALGTPRTFSPMPRERLPFPAWVVGSRNDPYATFERSAAFARAWGAQLLDAGRSGHLNVESGHGAWPRGAALLAALEQELDRRLDRKREPLLANGGSG